MNVCCWIPGPVKPKELFALPKQGDEQPQWGYIGIYDDVLLAGKWFCQLQATSRDIPLTNWMASCEAAKRDSGSRSFDVSASNGLIAFDRHSGEQLWSASAKHSFIHNGIIAGDGRVYCLDRLPGLVEAQLKRRGRSVADAYRIVAIDVHSGEQVWENTDEVFGSWLSYSSEHDVVLQAGASASDRLITEVRAGMAVHNADDGSVRWRDDERAYSGRASSTAARF